jgi:hypothetical protein
MRFILRAAGMLTLLAGVIVLGTRDHQGARVGAAVLANALMGWLTIALQDRWRAINGPPAPPDPDEPPF